MVGGELRGQFVRTEASGDGESAEIIERNRRDVISEAVVELVGGLLHLLAKEMKGRQRFGPRFVRINFDVVADSFRRPDCKNAASRKKFLFANALQQFLRVIEKLARLFSDNRIVENGRIAAAQFPSVEKR